MRLRARTRPINVLLTALITAVIGLLGSTDCARGQDATTSPPTAAQSTTEKLPPLPQFVTECQGEIATYLGKERPDITREYFALRARISMHRLAWLHLKQLKQDGKTRAAKSRVEDSILALLKQHDALIQSDPAFKASAEAFRERPFSRGTLASVLGPLTKAMQAAGGDEAPAAEAPFWLGVEDMKMIGMLGELEQIGDPKADRLTANHSEATSVLNFVRIIDSSYRTDDVADVDTQLARVESEVTKMEAELKAMHDRLFDAIRNKSDACKFLSMVHQTMGATCPTCGRDGATFESRIDLDTFLEKALNEQLRATNYECVRYNDVWLRTERTGLSKPGDRPLPRCGDGPSKPGIPSKTTRAARAAIKKKARSTPSAVTTAPTSAGKVTPPSSLDSELKDAETEFGRGASKKGKATPPPGVPGAALSATLDPLAEFNRVDRRPATETKEDLPIGAPAAEIQNPETVIANFTGARAPDVLALEPDRKQAWAQALLRNEPNFSVDNELFSSRDGSSVSVASSAAEARRALFSRNGKSLYAYAGAVYEAKSGQELARAGAKVDLEFLEKKYGIRVAPERNDRAYRLAHLIAVANGDYAFQAGTTFFSVQDESSLPSPYPPENTLAREDWRKTLNAMPDETKILQHQRQTWNHADPRDAGCRETIVVDKRAGRFRVYDRDTMVLRTETPIVLGRTKGDGDAALVNPEGAIVSSKGLKPIDDSTNGLTGAGEYRFRDQPYAEKKASGDPKEKQYAHYLKSAYDGRLVRLCKVDGDACENTPVALHAFYKPDRKERARAVDEASRVPASAGADASSAQRRSGGCINVPEKFYDAESSGFREMCSVFVLPEEAGNHFEVGEDKRLRLVKIGM